MPAQRPEPSFSRSRTLLTTTMAFRPVVWKPRCLPRVRFLTAHAPCRRAFAARALAVGSLDARGQATIGSRTPETFIAQSPSHVRPGRRRDRGPSSPTRRCRMTTQVGTIALQLGSIAPDFEAETTEGPIRFHDWIGDSWAVLFSHPKDFTPVCTTELGYMARLKPEFDKRRTKVIGLSVDPVGNHAKWAEDIRETQGHAPNFPMIGDTTLAVSKLYGMLPADLEGTCDGRTAADNQTVRTVFVIGPDKKIKLMIAYPMTTGRNFDEVLRVIDSMHLTAAPTVATPGNWNPGKDVSRGVPV